ncbi:hypothetical protein Barb4_00341 [Bacteroidales bacterium Barb4]|nr:hypothetical protein Barb4_00341 [Bacteroidales bacterium Barb4]
MLCRSPERTENFSPDNSLQGTLKGQFGCSVIGSLIYCSFRALFCIVSKTSYSIYLISCGAEISCSFGTSA